MATSMLIKKFQAASEQEALQLAKQELGKDVIITHIKSIKPKGIYRLFKKPVVEVTAAVDRDETYEREPLRPAYPETMPQSLLDIRLPGRKGRKRTRRNDKNNGMCPYDL